MSILARNKPREPDDERAQLAPAEILDLVDREQHTGLPSSCRLTNLLEHTPEVAVEITGVEIATSLWVGQAHTLSETSRRDTDRLQLAANAAHTNLHA